MGFFDEYEPLVRENEFLTGDEKKQIVAAGTPMMIRGVVFDPTNTYKERSMPRYVVTFEVDNRPRKWSFSAGSVASRDHQLDALIEYLAREDSEPPIVLVVQDGRAYRIVQA